MRATWGLFLLLIWPSFISGQNGSSPDAKDPQNLQTGYCPQTHQLEAEPSQKFFFEGSIGKRRVRMYLDRGGSGVVGLFFDIGGDWATTLLGGTWNNGQIDAVDDIENHPGTGHLSASLTGNRLSGTWTGSTGGDPEPVELVSIAEPRCDGEEAWKRFENPDWPVTFSYPSSWHVEESQDDSVVLSCPDPAAIAFDRHITIYHGTGAPKGPTELVQCGKSWLYGYECKCNEQDSHRCPTAKMSLLKSATMLDVSEREHRIYCLDGGYVAAGEGEDRVILLGDQWLEINSPYDTSGVMKRIIASITWGKRKTPKR